MNCIRLLRLAAKQRLIIFPSSARYISQHPIRFLETQDMWREKDGVSKRWQLIYKAPMSTALNVTTTYLTVTTGITGIGGAYYAAFVYDAVDLSKPVLIGDDIVIANTPTECFVYLGVFIALHLAVKILLSKYVVRLYQDGNEYLAVYRGHFFNSVQKHQFNLKDFHKLDPNMIIPWSESMYSLGKKQGILMENYFKTPEYLNYLLYKKNKSEDE